MSLVEVVIAMTLFAVVLAAVMQAVTAVIQYGALGEAEDDLNRSAVFVMRAISDDLYCSGWNIPSSTILPTAWSAPVPVPPVSPAPPPGDREISYYPYAIEQGTASGLGNMSGNHAQAPAVYDWWSKQGSSRQTRLRDSLVGSSTDFTATYTSPPTAAERSAFMVSYFARSTSLVFVKTMVDEWSPAPTAKSRGRSEFGRIDFKSAEPRFPGDPRSTTDAQWRTLNNQDALGVLYGSPWTFVLDGTGAPQLARRVIGDNGVTTATVVPANPPEAPPYGVVITAGRYNSTNSGELTPMWETVLAPDYGGGAQSATREYVYCVVPSPIGVGRLVRAHLEAAPLGALAAVTVNSKRGIFIGDVLSPNTANPAMGMVVDSVLSDDVTRIVFETFRTQPAGTINPLAINQVRMRVFLARLVETSNGGGGVVKTTIDTVVNMRARNTAPQLVEDTALVPALPNGFQF